MIKFIAADMDGTLLDQQGQLSADFFPLHQRLVDSDILFAAASGRQYYSLLSTFESIQDQMLFIAENGTLVMHQGKEIYSHGIPSATIQRLITVARQIPNAALVLCGKRSAYVETQDPQALEEISKYYHRCEQVSDLLAVEDDFIKLAICHFEGTEAHVWPLMQQHFAEDMQVVLSGKIWLDVMSQGASKGAAIEFLQDKYNFSFEQTMSFGDYFNDLEMLQASYHSYAMENAHKDLKPHARFRAPSNRDNGVLQVIENYLNNR